MVNKAFFTSAQSLNEAFFNKLPHVIKICGNLQNDIDHVAELKGKDEGCCNIGFIMHRDYIADLQDTQLSAVIVTPELLEYVPKNCYSIVSDKPRLVFAAVMAALYPFIFDTVPENSSDDAVDPTAVIGKNVRLGKGVIIGAGAVVGDDCQVGDYTVIGDHVELGKNCRIGRHNTIRYAVIGDEFWCDDHNALGCAGFAFEFDQGRYVPIAQVGLLKIGQGVHISSGSSIDRGALGDTVIEDLVQIESLCKIGHNVHIGAATAIVGHCAIAGSAKIGRGVQIAGKVGVKGFTEIGDGALVMACSAVTKNVAPKSRVFGVPAMEFREYGAQAQELHKLVAATKKKKQTRSE